MRASLLLLIPLMACGAADGQNTRTEEQAAPAAHTAIGKKVVGDGQLTEYVRRIFQDSKGHYWFGSNGDGIYRYAGTRLEVFSTEEGLAGDQVTGILEDRTGAIWIGTDGGVSRFDGNVFTNYTMKDGLPSNGCWSIFEARDGTIWVGTAEGPCRYEAATTAPHARGRFIAMAMPSTDPQNADGAGYWISCIAQDRAGDLWFATREAGAFRFDGRSFPRPIATKGLNDNELACILFDSKGGMWVSSMNAGLARFEGDAVQHFAAPDVIGSNEVWTMYEDREGNIWFDSEGYGVYRYDGNSLRNYAAKEGLGVLAVQTIYQDRDGTIWCGGGGGLYRLDGDTMVHVKRNGPWR